MAKKKEMTSVKLDKNQMSHYLNLIKEDHESVSRADVFKVVRDIEDFNVQKQNVKIENLADLYLYLIDNFKLSA